MPRRRPDRRAATTTPLRRRRGPWRVAPRTLRRYRLRPVQRALGRTRATALFTFLNVAVSIGVMAVFAHLASAPLIFPSLGPTAYLVFSRPLAPASSPRHTLLGHAIGAAAGWASLAAFGLSGEPSALLAGVTWARVGAAALSLGATGGAMVATGTDHPPAGATTLIVSLGLMTGAGQLVALLMAVVLLIAQAWAINRLAGVPYPRWAPRGSG